MSIALDAHPFYAQGLPLLRRRHVDHRGAGRSAPTALCKARQLMTAPPPRPGSRLSARSINGARPSSCLYDHPTPPTAGIMPQTGPGNTPYAPTRTLRSTATTPKAPRPDSNLHNRRCPWPEVQLNPVSVRSRAVNKRPAPSATSQRPPDSRLTSESRRAAFKRGTPWRSPGALPRRQSKSSR